MNPSSFLDATRISIRGVSVRWSVGPWVHGSVGPWVRHAFIKNSFFVDFWALLPLPTRTRLMAVYPAFFLCKWVFLISGSLIAGFHCMWVNNLQIEIAIWRESI